MTIPSKPTAIAVVKFMDNGDVTVTLTSCQGVTARRLEVAQTALYKKLSEMRAIERRKDMVASRAANAAASQDEVNENG